MKMSTIQHIQQNLFELETVIQKCPKQKEKRENSFVFDLVDALSSPILTFNRQWADTLPKRILDKVTMARMIALMQKEELATYPECTIYIYTRTFEAPMNSDWTNIYLYVSCKTLEHWLHEDHWETVGAPRKLNEWLSSKLDGLRHHIYNKRREILKERLKSDEKAGDENDRTIKNKTHREKQSPDQQQCSLF